MSGKMHTKKRKKRAGRGRRVALSICLAVLLIGLSALVGGILYLAPYASETMDMSLMEIPEVSMPSVLYAYDAAKRADRSGEMHPAEGCVLSEARPHIFVAYEDLPPDLIHAFVAIEDRRFYSHAGVDLWRTARAGVDYLIGNGSFGGSTITQQLIKNLTGSDEYTLDRKFTEIFRALDLEQKADKATILETYLNVINLAEGCHGVGMAAKRYYSKEASELSLSECAAIAAITNNPARYDPITHPESNRARRDLILHEMAEQGYITEAERDEAIATDLGLHPSEPEGKTNTVTSWYADMVAADVIRDLQERLGCTYAHASMLVYSGGLTIETAMDEELQRVVEAYYADLSHFPVGEAGRPQSSFILIDPATGDILAVAGAAGEKTGNRLQNYATDTRRPAGSCIKPLSVYAPALQKGLITWARVFEDEPVSERNGRPWPGNADGLYRGRVTVGTAVSESINTVAVRILEELGEEASFSFLRDDLHMRSLLPATAGQAHDQTVSSLALGQQSRGVTVRELTAGYTIFQNGLYRAPISYHRVLDREGRVLLENTGAEAGERVLSEGNAAVMTRLLMTVTEQGTAARYMTLYDALGIESAGKTGTTQNTCDRWFVGYTPRLLAGVWMGYDYPTELRGISGNPCVSIWDSLMTACEARYRGAPEQRAFETPADVLEAEFCPLSGSLPNPFCTDPVEGHPTERGWFVAGTEPQDTCTIHEEPPVVIQPEDPADPDRVPLLPNDLLPAPDAPPSDPWYSRWFSQFARPRRKSKI